MALNAFVDPFCHAQSGKSAGLKGLMSHQLQTSFSVAADTVALAVLLAVDCHCERVQGNWPESRDCIKV